MYEFFQYNWQVRDEWLDWCEQLPEGKLFKKRVGGVGNILHTLLHIIDVEYSWIRAIQGKSDIAIDFNHVKNLKEVRELSNQYRGEINDFLLNDKTSDDKMVTASWIDGDFTKQELLHHIIAHEIHHIGQLSIWARELDRKPVSANVIFRGLFLGGFFMNIKVSDGVSLFVEKEGNGIPCIFVHGGPGYWSKSFKDLTGNLLAEEMEMIYLDQRGCGRSDISDNADYSLDRLLLDMEEIRLHLGINQWYMMGHSFGGILAVKYATRFPDRVKGLILSNVTLDMKDSFASQITKGRELLGLDAIDLPKNNVPELLRIFYETVQQLMEKDLFYRLQFQSLLDKEKLDESDEEFQAKSGFQQYIFSNDEYFQDFRKLTSMISAPALVLSGKYDYAVGPDHQENFKFKDAVFKVMDSGHHPYVENPISFKNTISEFINS